MLTEYEGRPDAWWVIEEGRHSHNVILRFGAAKTIEELQQFLKGFSTLARIAEDGTRPSG